MTLTKANIVDQIAEKNEMHRKEAVRCVEIILETLKSTLESGDDILVSGFGKFCVREKKERWGRNPATGKGAQIKPRKVVTFKCSGVLRDKVNGK